MRLSVSFPSCLPFLVSSYFLYSSLHSLSRAKCWLKSSTTTLKSYVPRKVQPPLMLSAKSSVNPSKHVVSWHRFMAISWIIMSWAKQGTASTADFFKTAGKLDAVFSCWYQQHPHLWNNCMVWKHIRTRQETSGQDGMHSIRSHRPGATVPCCYLHHHTSEKRTPSPC